MKTNHFEKYVDKFSKQFIDFQKITTCKKEKKKEKKKDHRTDLV